MSDHVERALTLKSEDLQFIFVDWDFISSFVKMEMILTTGQNWNVWTLQ